MSPHSVVEQAIGQRTPGGGALVHLEQAAHSLKLAIGRIENDPSMEESAFELAFVRGTIGEVAQAIARKICDEQRGL